MFLSLLLLNASTEAIIKYKMMFSYRLIKNENNYMIIAM